MKDKSFWTTYNEVDSLLKQAFIQMPGGQNKAAQQDPAAGGMPPPGDPAAGGMPPPGDPAAGGMPPPGDPAAAGGMPPPGMDPAAAGGMPPPGMDPAMMGGMPPPPGMDPAMMGGAGAGASGSPMITISLDQLFEIIQKVLGLAKKVGANGSGLSEAAASPAVNQDQLKATIYEALGQMAN